MSLLGGGTTAAVGRSGPCSSIDAAMRGNGGRSMAPKAKACMRNAAVATAKTKSAMDTLLAPTLAPAALARPCAHARSDGSRARGARHVPLGHKGVDNKPTQWRSYLLVEMNYFSSSQS